MLIRCVVIIVMLCVLASAPAIAFMHGNSAGFLLAMAGSPSGGFLLDGSAGKLRAQ